MRIVWRHHPLYLKTAGLVEFWQGKDGRFVVIELPDGSHTRIPASWADDGEGPIGAANGDSARLSVAGIREMLELHVRLQGQKRAR